MSNNSNNQPIDKNLYFEVLKQLKQANDNADYQSGNVELVQATEKVSNITDTSENNISDVSSIDSKFANLLEKASIIGDPFYIEIIETFQKKVLEIEKEFRVNYEEYRKTNKIRQEQIDRLTKMVNFLLEQNQIK